MSTTEDLRRFAAERGITLHTAQCHRYKGRKPWLDWCRDNNIDPAPPQRPRPTVKRKEQTGTTKAPRKAKKGTTKAGKVEIPSRPSTVCTNATAARYKEVEEQAFRQLRQVQAMLDTALDENDIGATRLLTQTVNDAIRAYETAVKSRISHDMLEGRFIPASVVEHYKSTFYPAISQAVENLRSQLLFAVPEEQRAAVATAWDLAYHVYVEGVTEAEAALNTLSEGAAEAATTELKKTRNNLTKG